MKNLKKKQKVKYFEHYLCNTFHIDFKIVKNYFKRLIDGTLPGLFLILVDCFFSTTGSYCMYFSSQSLCERHAAFMLLSRLSWSHTILFSFIHYASFFRKKSWNVLAVLGPLRTKWMLWKKKIISVIISREKRWMMLNLYEQHYNFTSSFLFLAAAINLCRPVSKTLLLGKDM